MSDTQRVSTLLTRKLGQVATKAQQSKAYRPVPRLLRQMREEAGISQRELGVRLHRPQSWVYNCETANRRVDVAEFKAWAAACEIAPEKAFARFIAGG